MTSEEKAKAVVEANGQLYRAMNAYLIALTKEATTFNKLNQTEAVEALWRKVRRSVAGSIITKAYVRNFVEEAFS